MGRDGDGGLTAQTDAADEADVDDVAMAEAGGAEVDDVLCGTHEVGACGLVREEGHHEVLQEALGAAEVHVRALRGIRGLLEEDGVAGQLEDVDGDAQALGGEGGVHDGDVLVSEVAGDGEDEDAGEEAAGGVVDGVFGAVGVCFGSGGRAGFGVGDGGFVDVGEGEGEGAGHLGRGGVGDVAGGGGVDQFAQGGEEVVLDEGEGPEFIRVVGGGA